MQQRGKSQLLQRGCIHALYLAQQQAQHHHIDRMERIALACSLQEQVNGYFWMGQHLRNAVGDQRNAGSAGARSIHLCGLRQLTVGPKRR